MNKVYRQGLINKIDKAIKDASLVSPELEHKYLIGKYKEILLGQLINPFLASQYNTGSGKIVDFQNHISSEVDIVIYSKGLIPPQLFSSGFGVYPSESVLSCIEVKSNLDGAELKSVFDKYKKIKNEIKYSAGKFDKHDKPINHLLSNFSRDVFAFKSIDNIFNKYKEIDTAWDSDEPIVNSFCVVGRGWWGFCDKKWKFVPADEHHEEVIKFLSTLINTLPKVAKSRGCPRIDQYLNVGEAKEL